MPPVPCLASGLVPPTVDLARASPDPDVRKLAAALLSQLSASNDAVSAVREAGGIPACVRALEEGSDEARVHAAKALDRLALDEECRQHMVR